MKQGIQILVGSLILASALSACGKKDGAKAAAPATNATIGCVQTAQGICSTATGGIMGVGEGRGSMVVSNPAKFQQFLLDNGMCSGMTIQQHPMFRRPGLPCNLASNYFELVINSTNEKPLPKRVNFNITALLSGREVSLAGQNYQQVDRYGRPYGGSTYGRNMTSADIYGLANGGFQLDFMRGGVYGGPVPYGRYGVVPQQVVPQQNIRLNVVLNPADATRTIFTAVVSYQGVQIATGQFYGSFGYAGQGLGVSPNGYAPEVLPAAPRY